MSKGVTTWIKRRRIGLVVGLVIIGTLGMLLKAGVDRILEASARTNSV